MVEISGTPRITTVLSLGKSSREYTSLCSVHSGRVNDPSSRKAFLSVLFHRRNEFTPGQSVGERPAYA